MPLWFIQCVFGVVAALGLLLLWTGLRPRRTGSALLCRACGYDLTGNTSGRCPECGRDLNVDRATVIGRRVKRTRRVAFGLVLVMLGAAPLALGLSDRVRNFDWYHCWPTGWVLDDLGDTDLQVSRRAVAEIDRRRQTGQLSNAQLQRLIATCLAEQTRATPRGMVTQLLSDVLCKLMAAQRLSPDQERQAYENMLRFVEIETPPEYVVGEPMPVRVVLRVDPLLGTSAPREPSPYACEGPVAHAARAVVTLPSVTLAGETIISDGWLAAVDSHEAAHGTIAATFVAPDPTQTGCFDLELELTFEVRDPPSGDVLHVWTQRAKRTISVRAEAPVGRFTVMRDADSGESLRRLVIASPFGRKDSPPQVVLDIALHSLEAPWAAEVLLMRGGEVPAGYDPPFLCFVPSKYVVVSSAVYLERDDLLESADGTTTPVDIVLVPTTRAALTMVDRTFCGHTLIFRDVRSLFHGDGTMTTGRAEIVDPATLNLPPEIMERLLR